MAKEYNAVLCNSGGAQVIAFFKQWKQFGLDKVYPQILGQATVPIVSMLSELGDSALGVYSSLHYYDGIPQRPTRSSGKASRRNTATIRT